MISDTSICNVYIKKKKLVSLASLSEIANLMSYSTILLVKQIFFFWIIYWLNNIIYHIYFAKHLYFFILVNADSSLLNSWQVLKQIIDKISNWIPNQIQSRLLFGIKRRSRQISKYQILLFQVSKLLFKLLRLLLKLS